MSGDGNLWDNKNLYKSTGRYPTIPTVYALKDDIAKSFKFQIKQSEIPSRWSDIAKKQEEFNNIFESDYYENCYAGRYENTWVAYNPNKDGSNCGAVLSLKYNTCKNLDVNFNEYGNALIKEYSDRIDIYENNFDEKAQTTLRTDTFKISGCSSKPSYSAKDTGVNQTKSEISESYSNGTYTLTVKHNGPVEISIKCSGNETGKQSAIKESTVKVPASPSFYTGIRQYEGEFFDTKNVEGYVQNACKSGVTGIQGQGFLKFGKNSSASAKDTVSTDKAGDFTFSLRYSSLSDISNVDLYVNDAKIETMKLSNTNGYSNWKTYQKKITLRQGDNKIEFKANSELSSSLYLDCFTVEGNFGDSEVKPVEPINGKLIKNLVVSDTEHAENWSVQYDFNKNSQIFGDRSFTCIDLPSELIGAEYIRTACDSKTVTKDLGTFTAGDDITVYIATDKRVVSILPDWLKDWKKTGGTVTADNDLTFEIYKKSFESGENVTLGMNGGTGNNVNYIVLAKTTETVSENLAGDANLDGKVDIADVVAVASYVGNSDVNKLEPQGIINADVQGDGNGLNANDSLMIQQYLANIIENL